MTLQEFAQTIIDDPNYRESVIARARDGTLPQEIEELLLNELAVGRYPPIAASRAVAATAQSPTLALIRPTAFERGEP